MEAPTALSSEVMPRAFVANLKQKSSEDKGSPFLGSEDVDTPRPIVNAHVVALRLLFTAWISHFRSLGYIKESTMDMLDKTVLKRSVQVSVRDFKAR